MKSSCTVEFSAFKRKVEATISAVGATKSDIIEATNALAADSLSEVPRQTHTLADSCFTEIIETPFGITGVVGYGGNGDPINPISKKPASYYMVKVHEDLSAVHPIGKAKYLEDPFNRRKILTSKGIVAKVKSFIKRIWR